MRVPENYPDELSTILDAHVAMNLLPSWYCVNYLNLKEDFHAFFQQQSLSNISICDFFGRSHPYASSALVSDISTFEPRSKFVAVSSELYGDKVKQLDIDALEFESYDLILINLEFGGLTDHGMPRWINEKFTRNSLVFGYELNQPRTNKSLFYRSDDNALVNIIEQFHWYKHIVSHVHEGVNKIEGKYITFFDMNINY
ncbi:MAG: hypothetical protein ACJAS1_001982 [Oleiphilaceae bacterium]|jgi:hypothetical protein